MEPLPPLREPFAIPMERGRSANGNRREHVVFPKDLYFFLNLVLIFSCIT